MNRSVREKVELSVNHLYILRTLINRGIVSDTELVKCLNTSKNTKGSILGYVRQLIYWGFPISNKCFKIKERNRVIIKRFYFISRDKEVEK